MQRTIIVLAMTTSVGFTFAALRGEAADSGEPLKLHARSRTLAKDGDAESQSRAVEKPVEWDPRKTALIICDMWDDHWCRGAARRVVELAPVVNTFAARGPRSGRAGDSCPQHVHRFL